MKSGFQIEDKASFAANVLRFFEVLYIFTYVGVCVCVFVFNNHNTRSFLALYLFKK